MSLKESLKIRVINRKEENPEKKDADAIFETCVKIPKEDGTVEESCIVTPVSIRNDKEEEEEEYEEEEQEEEEQEEEDIEDVDTDDGDEEEEEEEEEEDDMEGGNLNADSIIAASERTITQLDGGKALDSLLPEILEGGYRAFDDDQEDDEDHDYKKEDDPNFIPPFSGGFTPIKNTFKIIDAYPYVIKTQPSTLHK